jgi:tellurite resistance protein
MLTDEKKNILKLLIALAWADGRVDEEELEVVEALLDAYGANEEESELLRAWAGEPRTLDDVDTTGISVSDAELALQHGVLLTHIDGEQSADEVELINKFVDKLGLPEELAKPIMESANRFAKDLLPELKS